MQSFNTQKMLFGNEQQETVYFDIPEEFYRQGYTLFDVATAESACDILTSFCANIDGVRVPIFEQLRGRIRFGKADRIPVCADSVATNFQALHFDMGQPIISDEPQLMFPLIGLYMPLDGPEKSAATKILPLRGLCSNMLPHVVEDRLISYAIQHGDGWIDDKTGEWKNTKRLQYFARIHDAIAGGTTLAGMRDVPMARWFASGCEESKRESQERKFHMDLGMDISRREHVIRLAPGQLLVIDNTRTVHGRVGTREREEIYQFMFGTPNATPEDVACFRTQLTKEMTS